MAGKHKNSLKAEENLTVVSWLPLTSSLSLILFAVAHAQNIFVSWWESQHKV